MPIEVIVELDFDESANIAFVKDLAKQFIDDD
jgi:hypothetical protein